MDILVAWEVLDNFYLHRSGGPEGLEYKGVESADSGVNTAAFRMDPGFEQDHDNLAVEDTA